MIPWSAEEVLHGRQRKDIPAHARTVQDGLPQKNTGRRSLLRRPTYLPEDLIAKGTELNCSCALQLTFEANRCFQHEGHGYTIFTVSNQGTAMDPHSAMHVTMLVETPFSFRCLG